MADPIIVRTRLLTREQIAQFIKSPRGVRAFEELTQDTSSTLPAAILVVQTQLDYVDAAMHMASDVADSAKALAQAAHTLAAQLEALQATTRGQQTTINNLRAELEDLRAIVLGL